MKTAFNFVTLLTSLLIATAASHSQTQKKDRFAKDALPSGTLPFLTCTTFYGDIACNALCAMIGSIYGHVIDYGTCQNEFNCNCPMSTDVTLDDLWNAKFIAKSVLKEIRDNDRLSKEVLKILQKPLRTREQTLQDLQTILTPEQLGKIKVKDTIAKVLKVDGEPDKNALKKYVAKKLTTEPTPLNLHVYLSLLDDFFKTPEKESSAHLIREIRRSDNKVLNDYFDRIARTQKIREPSKDTYPQETFIEILDTAITNGGMSSRKPSKKNQSLTRKPSSSAKSGASEEAV